MRPFQLRAATEVLTKILIAVALTAPYPIRADPNRPLPDFNPATQAATHARCDQAFGYAGRPKRTLSRPNLIPQKPKQIDPEETEITGQPVVIGPGPTLIDPKTPDPAELESVRKKYGPAKNFVRKGGFGTVYDGVIPDTGLGQFKAGEEIVVKIAHRSEIAQKLLANEGRSLAKIDDSVDPDRRLVRGHYDPSIPALVVERVYYGMPLKTYLAFHGSPALRQKLAGQLKEAQSALVKAGIVHGDLGEQNVMVDAKGNLKIIDFGASSRPGGYPVDRERLHTAGFARPEHRDGQPADFKDDAFAFDVLRRGILSDEWPNIHDHFAIKPSPRTRH